MASISVKFMMALPLEKLTASSANGNADFPNLLGQVKFPANNDVIENIDLGQGYYPAMVFVRDKKLNPETHAVSEFVSLVEGVEGKDKT